MSHHNEQPGTLPISRRTFVKATGGALIATLPMGRAAAAAPAKWSDPATWGGSVPGRRDIAVITKPVVLDVNARVAGVVVRYGGALIFDPLATRTLQTKGNVVVKGTLRMRPARAAVTHKIVFVDIDESAFRGGGHEVLASDVGLWVMHHGWLDIAGTPKAAWARATADIESGQLVITLDREPVGWRPGDEIVISPTTPPDVAGFSDHFDSARLTSVVGPTITLDRATAHAHPAPSYGGRTFAAEVLNLTRNVRIQGTNGGRAHVFIHSEHPSNVKYAQLTHVGPRMARGNETVNVLGRYGLHFHHSYGSRGSVVEGVVVTQAGNHAFVPHTSHGVTFRSCIAYNVQEAAFWWDEGDVTNDTLWDDCVAARVFSTSEVIGHKSAGFFLGKGLRNVMRNCVAVGCKGFKTSPGFMWPAEPVAGVWTAEDFLTHNNLNYGIFVWQNNSKVNVVARAIAFHNGIAGLNHGSLSNAFRYEECLFAANGASNLELHANPDAGPDDGGLVFDRVALEGGGITPYGLHVANHLEDPTREVKHRSLSFRDHTVRPVLVRETNAFGSRQDYVACTVGPENRDLEPEDFELVVVSPETLLRVQRQDQTAYKIDSSRAATPIPPFD